MRIIIDSTTKLVMLELANGSQVPARVWQGHTPSGTPVQAFITRVAPEIPKGDPDIDERAALFERDLKRCVEPRPSVEAIPLRLLIE